MEEDMFCYIHEGGQLVKCVGGSVQYQGGRSESMVVSRHMSHSDFVSKLLLKMFRFNEMFCHVYVSSSSEVVEGCIAPNSAPSPIVGSNSAHLLPSGGDLPINICNDSLTIESYGFSHRCAEANILERDSRRFRYRFKRNSTKHMTVVCTVTKCPWKVTARAIGDSNIVQSTPDYQPRQICKDFQRQHGMQLTYLQAWNIKEKANERIYGEPKYYYKLLPWMCEKMVATNPGSIVELGHSSDGHFEQLFVAHSVSIQGFAMGCRPIIAIDSAHMSGPYRGALFSATAYDANDAMFP
ncbi:hypothetical protein CK203_045422 [Vitis vinifera]|uniref:Transposase MuDR plant domain-containing protein n=1 Tax=Vitis vinifera TaxID=29760 RepID=A0A438H9C9_VITVI|nr:hypothetical protein CK203_045422 [Vitis vinifera]